MRRSPSPVKLTTYKQKPSRVQTRTIRTGIPNRHQFQPVNLGLKSNRNVIFGLDAICKRQQESAKENLKSQTQQAHPQKATEKSRNRLKLAVASKIATCVTETKQKQA